MLELKKFQSLKKKRKRFEKINKICTYKGSTAFEKVTKVWQIHNYCGLQMQFTHLCSILDLKEDQFFASKM